MLKYGTGLGVRAVYGPGGLYDIENIRDPFTFNRTPALSPDNGPTNAIITAAGIDIIPSIGAPTVAGTAQVAASGNGITSAIGDETLVIDASVAPDGAQATVDVGTPAVTVTSVTDEYRAPVAHAYYRYSARVNIEQDETLVASVGRVIPFVDYTEKMRRQEAEAWELIYLLAV